MDRSSTNNGRPGVSPHYPYRDVVLAPADGWAANRVTSFRCAFAGLWHTLRTQPNAQIHVGVALVIVALGLFLDINLFEWAILALTMGFVIVTEMLNTVAEAAMDIITTDYHPQVKTVKDVAAGAVLLAAMTSVVVGLLILGPPLFRFVWGLVFG